MEYGYHKLVSKELSNKVKSDPRLKKMIDYLESITKQYLKR